MFRREAYGSRGFSDRVGVGREVSATQSCEKRHVFEEFALLIVYYVNKNTCKATVLK